jgi:uncharacterized OB-fold protein
MNAYNKPLPYLDPESRPFWEGAKAHKLLLVQCRSCKTHRFPPTTFCAKCSSDAYDWVEAKGTGKVFSWIVVRHPVPKEVYAAEVPYIVALIALDEGVRMTSNIIDCKPEDVTADMRVSVTFRDVTPEITLPAFTPAKG